MNSASEIAQARVALEFGGQIVRMAGKVLDPEQGLALVLGIEPLVHSGEQAAQRHRATAGQDDPRRWTAARYAAENDPPAYFADVGIGAGQGERASEAARVRQQLSVIHPRKNPLRNSDLSAEPAVHVLRPDPEYVPGVDRERDRECDRPSGRGGVGKSAWR